MDYNSTNIISQAWFEEKERFIGNFTGSLWSHFCFFCRHRKQAVMLDRVSGLSDRDAMGVE
jgi:hypothetical protein